MQLYLVAVGGSTVVFGTNVGVNTLLIGTNTVYLGATTVVFGELDWGITDYCKNMGRVL